MMSAERRPTATPLTEEILNHLIEETPTPLIEETPTPLIEETPTTPTGGILNTRTEETLMENDRAPMMVQG